MCLLVFVVSSLLMLNVAVCYFAAAVLQQQQVTQRRLKDQPKDLPKERSEGKLAPASSAPT